MEETSMITFREMYSSVLLGFPDSYPFAEYYEKDKKVCLYKKDYINRINAIAAALEKKCKQIEKGRWIALKYPTHVYWYAVFFALEKIGYKVMLLDDKIDKKTLEHCMKLGDLAAIVGNETEGLIEIPYISFEEVIRAEEGKPEKVCWQSQMCFCTSGTTNLSKAIVFNAETIWSVQRIVRPKFFGSDRMVESFSGLKSDGMRVLEVLPLRHVYAFQVSAIYWGYGCTLVFPKNQGIFEIAESIRRDKIWMTYGVPAFWKALFRVYANKMNEINPKTFKSMFGKQFQYGMTGGARINVDFRRLAISTGIQFMNSYGSTETGAYVAFGFCNDSPENGIPGEYSGTKVNNHDIYIIKENGDILREGTGELAVGGNTIYNGILQNGEFFDRRDLYGELFKTGDIFHVDNGVFYYQGRADHMIINDEGENIYPEELEEEFAILEDKVDQFCVIGWGNEIAVIVKTSEDQAEILQIIRKKNTKLPYYKRITLVFFVEEALPVTLKGEVSRKNIRNEIEKRECIAGAIKEVSLRARKREE